jgi:hypothetical protein
LVLKIALRAFPISLSDPRFRHCQTLPVHPIGAWDCQVA